MHCNVYSLDLTPDLPRLAPSVTETLILEPEDEGAMQVIPEYLGTLEK